MIMDNLLKMIRIKGLPSGSPFYTSFGVIVILSFECLESYLTTYRHTYYIIRLLNNPKSAKGVV